MRDAALPAGRHLVGADVEAAIDGGGVAADDLSVEAFGESEAERALARGVGPRIATSRGTSERGARAGAGQREFDQCGEDDQHPQHLHP